MSDYATRIHIDYEIVVFIMSTSSEFGSFHECLVRGMVSKFCLKEETFPFTRQSCGCKNPIGQRFVKPEPGLDDGETHFIASCFDVLLGGVFLFFFFRGGS